MRLGAFSVSLSVKNIKKSRDFYMKLGFEVFAGDIDQNWIILRNGDCVIGLFQGMFEKNLLTFNPRWNQDASIDEKGTDVRIIQQELKKQGIALSSEVDENTTGPGNFMITDPDGNEILFDQHI